MDAIASGWMMRSRARRRASAAAASAVVSSGYPMTIRSDMRLSPYELMGEDSVAGLGEDSLAERAATSRAGRWRWRLGVAAFLIDLGTRDPPAPPDREHDR